MKNITLLPVGRQPVIGITSQLIRTSKWYKEVAQFGVRAVEINRRHSKLHFNLYFLEKVKAYLKGMDLSLHSGTTGIFQDLDSFTDAELANLRAEVFMCRFLGARELVFHLNGQFLGSDGKRRLQDIISEARDQGVELLYESDTVTQALATFDVLEAFPDIGYVLDIGHLNNGQGQGVLGCGIEEFMRQIRHRVIYIHASNNCGTIDEHKGLEEGTLNWRMVFDRLDMRRIRKVIIEVRSQEYLAASKKALEDYLGLQRTRLPMIRCQGKGLVESTCIDQDFPANKINTAR